MATDHSRPESAIPSADDVWQTESEDTNDDDMDYEVREPPQISCSKLASRRLLSCRRSRLSSERIEDLEANRHEQIVAGQ
jgi:hypothetical protein